MFFVHILHSQSDGRLYTGYTNKLEQRISEHNSGKVVSIKDRRPLTLIYYEAYLSEDDAKGRELFLKSGSGKNYLKKQLSHYFQEKPWRI